jgi:hypothetical protein
VSHELVKASPVIVPATVTSAALPELVERAGGTARFAWDEFFYAEHHNPRTQKAYMRAVKRFLGWAEGEGAELAAITPVTFSYPCVMPKLSSSRLVQTRHQRCPIGPSRTSFGALIRNCRPLPVSVSRSCR